MPKGKCLFRKSDIKRAFEAAKEAGVKVRVQVQPGQITLIPDNDATDDATPPADQWDAALK